MQRGRKGNRNDPEKDLDLLPRAILETETGGQRPSPSFSFFIASMSSLRTRTQTSITNDRKVCGLPKRSEWFACVPSSPVLKHAQI